jgi:hypothetical protein
MRENRTYGSEGGESGTPDFPTPITGQGTELQCPAGRKAGRCSFSESTEARSRITEDVFDSLSSYFLVA